MQKNIAIKLRTWNATGRNILVGILKRIKDTDECAIRIACDAEDFRRMAASSSAIIADATADADVVQAATAAGMPVVLIADRRIKEHQSNLGYICTDNNEIGVKAADYLMSIGRFRSFGYVPTYARKEWSAIRERAFALRLERKGHDCRTFSHGKDGVCDLGAWLRALPKPAAVFCSWDGVAAEVANIAREHKIKIPSQMAILGVDNDETYCMSTRPQLSSIEFDAENEGRMAIELLFKIMSARKGKAAQIIRCGTVKRIVERESTRPPAPAAYLIERATAFISENATKGIGPKDVAAYLGVSRTLLDLRFREMGSATVGELISEQRLAALSNMLRKSKGPIVQAIKECGFGSVNHAKAVFRKRFGMTMREWRSNR